RTVRDVAVVVVGREDQHVAAGRAAAAAHAAGVPVGQVLHAQEVQAGRDLAGRVRVVGVGGRRGVTLGPVPERLGADVAVAVGLVVAGAGLAAGGTGGGSARALARGEAAQDPRDRVRQVAAVVDEVDVADAGAAGGGRAVAGVAVPAADRVHE